MKRVLRRAAALGLCTGLALTSLAGCSGKNKIDTDETAITVNDDTVSLGVLNFAVRYDQASLEDAYKSFGVTDPFSQDLFGTGETLGQMAIEEDVETLTHAVLAEQKMEEYGVSITDDDKAAITAAATAFIEANDEETLGEIGVTQESVERYLELEMIRYRMEPKMSEDVDTEVSDEEAAQRRVEYVFFAQVTEDEAETESESELITPAETEQSAETEAETVAETTADESESTQEEASLTRENPARTTAADETEAETTAAETEAETTAAETEVETETETETEDPATAEAMAKALAQAEEFLTKVQAGEDFQTAAEELGKTSSEVTFGSDHYVPEMVEATDGLADGTLVETPIKTDSGYYVVRVISQLDRDATDAEKENIVEQRKTDRIAELYDEWAEAGEITQNTEAIAQIVFDYSLTLPETEPETEAQTDVTPAEEAVVAPLETELQTNITPAETDVTPAETEA